MLLSRKIRVLVVDDSMLFRELMTKGLSSDASIEIVATAQDPFDARDKILKYKPDVMTCDIEMPKMDGIEFLTRLIPQYPLPVIVVSSMSKAVFEAMAAGAVDFVTKPNFNLISSIERFIYELIDKIKIASVAQPSIGQSLGTGSGLATIKVDAMNIIAIGASTGGTEAIYTILSQLPEAVPGIVITQHIPPVFSNMFAQRLNSQTKLSCKEAQTGDYVEPGKVLVAPGDKHMTVKKFGDKYRVEVFEGEKVNGHCPSVDVMFESVAKAAGNKALGIILTGMGYDGAKGLLAMRRKGARTIGQDEASSVVYGMPKVAFNIGAVERQSSLNTIHQLIFTMLNA